MFISKKQGIFLFGLTAVLLFLPGIFFWVFPGYSIEAQTLIWSSADCDYLSVLPGSFDSSINQFCAYVSGEYGYKSYKSADLNQEMNSGASNQRYCVYTDIDADCKNPSQPLPYNLYLCDESIYSCDYSPREGLQAAAVNSPCCSQTSESDPSHLWTRTPNLKVCYTCLGDKETRYSWPLISSVTCLDNKEYPVNQDYYSDGECVEKTSPQCDADQTECGTGLDSPYFTCCNNKTETCDANTKKCVSTCDGTFLNPCPVCGSLNGQVVSSVPSENDPNLCASGYSASDINLDKESLIVSWFCNNGKINQYCSAGQKGLKCYMGSVFPVKSTAKDPYKVYKGQAVEFVAEYQGGVEPITYGWTSYSSRGGFWIQNKANCKVGSKDRCKVIAIGTGNVSMGAWAKDADGKSIGPAHCYVNISEIPVLKLNCSGKYMDSGNIMFTFSASGGDSSKKYEFSSNTVNAVFEPPLNVGAPDEYITVLAKDVPDKGYLTASATVSSGEQTAKATCSVPIKPIVKCEWTPNPGKVTLGDTAWFEVVGAKGVDASESSISYSWSVVDDNPANPTPIKKHSSNPKIIGVAANKPGELMINVTASARGTQIATGKCSAYVYDVEKSCFCDPKDFMYYIKKSDANGKQLPIEICKSGYYCFIADDYTAKCLPASSKLGFPLDGTKCSEAYNKKNELTGSPADSQSPLKVSCTAPATKKTERTNLISFGLEVEGGTSPYTYKLVDYSKKLSKKDGCHLGVDEFTFDAEKGAVKICNPKRMGSHTFTITVSDNSSPTKSETRSCTINLAKGESGLTTSGGDDSCETASNCSKMPPIQSFPEYNYKFCAIDYASVVNITKAYDCIDKKCAIKETSKILNKCAAGDICEPYNYYGGEKRKDSKCVSCEAVKNIYSKKTPSAEQKAAIDSRCPPLPSEKPLAVKCIVSFPNEQPSDAATNTYTLYQGQSVTFSAQISGGSDANKNIADEDITWTGTACTGSDKTSINGKSCPGTAFKTGTFSATVKVNPGNNELIESTCNVEVIKPPTLRVSCSNQTVKLEQEATLTAFPEGGTGEYEYRWFSVGDRAQVGNDKILTGKPTKVGRYLYAIFVKSGFQEKRNQCTLTVVK